MRYIVGEGGCWLWQGALNHNGYGHLSVRGQPVPAHRAVYEVLVGPIPKGYQVHHSCRVRACVNPRHLEALPVERHGKITSPQRDTCIWGHPFDEVNTYVRANGERQCRKCKARRERERQQRLRAKTGAVSRYPAYRELMAPGL